MSKRAPMSVNPVTGELRVAKAAEDGTGRDGCLRLSDKYLNAARDAGLGGAGGMYSHLGSLKRVGETDIPSGMGSGGIARGGGGSKRSAGQTDLGGQPVRREPEKYVPKGTGKSALPPKGLRPGKPRIAQMAGGRVRKVSSGPTASKTKSYSFEKRRGVVNTMGGAKDTTRQEKEAALPRRGEAKANVHGFVGLSGTGEGRVATRAINGGDRPKGGMPNSSKGDAARGAPKVIHEPAMSGGTKVVVSKSVVGGKTKPKSAEEIRAARAAFFQKKK